MANFYLAENLLEDAKSRGQYATGDNALTDTEILKLMTEELIGSCTALLQKANEEYLVVSQDYEVAAGTASLRIPSRAVAGGLRTVSKVVNGNAYPMNRIEPGRAGRGYDGYELRGNKILFAPAPTAAITVRLTYLQRCSKVVTEDECGTITAINTGTGAVTVSAAPDTFTSSASYDFVKADPGFENPAVDQAATVAGNVLTFASLPDDLEVGDYVCLAGESPIPQIPVELHQYLTLCVAYRMAQAGNENAVVTNLAKLVDAAKKEALIQLTPRVGTAVRVISNPYGPGQRRRRR